MRIRRTAKGTVVLAGYCFLVPAGAQAIGVATDHVSQPAQVNNVPFHAEFAGVSVDGARVFFESAERLAASDSDGSVDVYMREGGTTTQISQGSTNGNGAFDARFDATSDDGSRVFFHSDEQLTNGDADTVRDVFMNQGGGTILISRGAQLSAPPTNASFAGSSADGSRVIFETGDRLEASDTDASTDVYAREGDTTTQISQSAVNGNGAISALFVGASADASRVFFISVEKLAVGDTDASTDLYLREGATTHHISEGGNDAFPVNFDGVSANGTRVLFDSVEKLAATDTDDSLDVYMREGATTTQVSQGMTNGNGAFGTSFSGASVDGSRVFFASSEKLAASDTDDSLDVYMREGGATTQISQGMVNGNGAFDASLVRASADGTRVVFQTSEALAASDTDAFRDLYTREAEVTTQISQGNGGFPAFIAGASTDASRVFFHTSESLTGSDNDASVDIYMGEGGLLTHISQGAVSDDGAFDAALVGLSTDGSRILFQTEEQLAATDTDALFDVYAARLDGIAPETTITQAPPAVTDDPTPSFEFTTSEPGPGSSFECKLDADSFAPCGSPHTTASVTEGAYSFEVRAVDAAGNADPTPAAAVFTLDLPPPPDLTVTIEIAGGKLRLRENGVVKLKLSCPDEEASPPCAGRVVVKTRKRLSLGEGKPKRKQKLAAAGFSIDAGESKSVRLKLAPAKRELVEDQASARKVVAIANVADAAANKATVTRNLKLVPR